MWNGKRVAAIIPAAGTGRRMGGERPKQFLEIAGIPILLRTLVRFEQSVEIDEIVAVVPEAEFSETERLVRGRQLRKVTAIVKGGKERQDSVWNGLQALSDRRIAIALIHDAARPFAGADLISAVIESAGTHGSAVPGILVSDTIKQSDAASFVLSTLDRSTLRSIQTPQGFEYAMLVNALRVAMKDGEYGTDEASIVERQGIRVKIVEGSPDNIKITTPWDLEVAELIARRLDHEPA